MAGILRLIPSEGEARRANQAETLRSRMQELETLRHRLRLHETHIGYGGAQFSKYARIMVKTAERLRESWANDRHKSEEAKYRNYMM